VIGKMLAHYRVGEQLGRGGMGEVYRADDIKLGQPGRLLPPLPGSEVTSQWLSVLPIMDMHTSR